MTPDDLYKQPRTRSDPITCLCFGPSRKEDYRDYFFCHGCDLLEDAVLNGSKRASRNQKRYMCTGSHVDATHPSTSKFEYRPRVECKEQNSDTKSPSKSPLKKKIRRVAGGSVAATAAITDTIAVGNLEYLDDEDKSDGEESINQQEETMPNPRRLFADSGSLVGVGSSVTTAAAAVTAAIAVGKFEYLDDENASGEEESNNQQSETPNPRCLFADLSLVREDNGNTTDSVAAPSRPAGDSLFGSPISDGLTCVEAENMQLKEHIIELVAEVKMLRAEIRQLKAAKMKVKEDEQEAKDDESPPDSKPSSKRGRLHDENVQLSRQLSVIIKSFLTSPPLSNRKKFSTSRLAKIVLGGVLCFEWTHSEIVKLSSKVNAVSDGDKKCPLFSTLATFMNAKLKRCRHDKNKAAILVDFLWDETLLNGEVKDCMIEKVRNHVRSNVFTPSKILKAMDLAGFRLSLAGLEVLRSVDATDKYSRGFLPSKSTILRCARKLEALADDYCPFEMIGQSFQDDLDTENDDSFGEGFEFDAIKTTETLFHAFGLMDAAKQRPVELGLSSDGAQLTHTISHVAAGLKFNDMAVRDPLTKSPLLLHEPDSLVQSRNLCFPLRIVIAKDSKKTLDGFRSLYDKFNSGEVSEALSVCPFKMSFPGDMKLQWTALNDGGAAKVKENFCYICHCRSSFLHVPQDTTKCHLCKDKPVNDSGEHCYHYPFLADCEVKGKLEEELLLLSSLVNEGLERLHENDIDNTSQRMYVRRTGQVAIVGDKLDIDFQPNTANDKAIFGGQITDELASRSMSLSGTLHDRMQRLRQQLVNEQRHSDIMKMLAASEPKDQAMYLVLHAIVCILHLENRVGLKSIESILRTGLSNARKGILEWVESNGENKRQEEYVQCITRIINTQILGTVMAPSQWRFPLSDDGNMGTLSMDNNRTRSVMNSIELIIEQSFPIADENKSRLLSCFPRYRAAIVILRKDTDCTEDEITKFQEHIDAWFCDWVKVYGREGCTNYTHMLSSSHVMRYMQEWKCLHRYSQQGWEALNALIKSYFFRRTNRGGLSRHANKKTKLLGIARWLQRRIMWYSGNADILLANNDTDDVDYDDGSSDQDSEDELGDISESERSECSIISDNDDDSGA